MKKILLSFLLVMFAICGTFAKEKKAEAKGTPLQVGETEWGFEISNVNAKGKKICIGSFSYDTENKEAVCFVFKTNNYSFFLTNFAEHFKNNKALGFVQGVGVFESGNATDFLPIENLANIEKILVVFTKGEFSKCSAFSDGKNMRVILSEYSEESESMLCKEVKEIERKEAEEQERQAKFEKQKEELPSLFAKSGKEGFDNMPWGTDVEFFQWLNPDAKKTDDEGSIENWERKTEQNTKFYKFHEGKLVGGVIVYNNINKQKVDDINHRLVELYGKASDAKDLGGHKKENVLGYYISYYDMHLRAIWNKSATFKIQQDVTGRELDDGFGIDFMTKAMLNQAPKITITYSNEKKMAAIKASDEKKKKPLKRKLNDKEWTI